MESVYSVKNELLKYLKQKTKYSYTNLKNNLLIESDERMVSLLLDALKDSIEAYNIETPVYYHKYLLKIIDYLHTDVGELEPESKEEIITKLKGLEYIINNILEKDYEKQKGKVDITKSVCISNKAFLLNLFSELKHIRYNLNGVTNVDLEKLQYEITDIIKICIFEIKDYNCVHDIIKNCRSFVVDEKLIIKVLGNYKNCLLNSKNLNEIIYYHKIILLMLDNLGAEYYYLKTQILLEIKQIESLSKNGIYSSEKVKQVDVFTGEIKNSINGVILPKEDILKLLKEKYQIEGEFKITTRPPKNWKQYKLDKSMIITIDNPKAKILENAISLEQSGENYYLKYYVIDLTAYTKEDKELEKHVIDRSLSIKGYPILPNKFARKNLSLQKGKYRKTIAFSFTLDKKLQVVNFKVERKLIKVKYNLSFADVLPILSDTKSSKLKNMLSLLYNVSEALNSDQQKLKDYHSMKEINKEILYNISYVNNYGSVLIGDYQIFLNSFVANDCYQKGYPYLYRNNEFSHNQEKLAEIFKRYQDNPELEDIIHAINSVYTPSTYSTVNKGHEGLDKVAYGEVSKPCRSAASYINLRQVIDYYIDGLVLNEDSKNALLHSLEKYCTHFNQKRELYDDYLREQAKIKKKK